MERMSYINYVETVDFFKGCYNPNQPFTFQEAINYILNVDKSARFCYANTRELYVGGSFEPYISEFWYRYIVWADAFSFSQILDNTNMINYQDVKFYLLYKRERDFEIDKYITEIIDYSKSYSFNDLKEGEIYITQFVNNQMDRYMYFPGIAKTYKINKCFREVRDYPIHHYLLYKVYPYYKDKMDSLKYINFHKMLYNRKDDNNEN